MLVGKKVKELVIHSFKLKVLKFILTSFQPFLVLTLMLTQFAVFEFHAVLNFCPDPLFQPHLLLFSALGLSSDLWFPEHSMLFHASVPFAHDLLPSLSRMYFIPTFKI